jgi:hypothetical protein
LDKKSNKATGKAIRRKAKALSLTDPKVVLLPPDVIKLVDKFRAFQRRSAEAYINLGVTVYAAAETLSREKLRQFCDEVGLEHEGDHYKRLSKVGRNAARFLAVLDKIPDKPTTIDWMAGISEDQFDVLRPHLTPESRKRELLALLPAGSRKERGKRKKTISAASDSPAWLIESSGPLDEGTMSDLQEELTRLIERFGLSMKPIASVTSNLSQ